METGAHGHHGVAAPRHVDQGQEAESEIVIIRSQLTEAAIVKARVLSQKSAIQTIAKVKDILKVPRYVYLYLYYLRLQ